MVTGDVKIKSGNQRQRLMVLGGAEGAFETSSLSSQLLFFSPGLCLYLLGCVGVHARVYVHAYV